VDGDSTDSPRVITSAFNDYFLSVVEKTLPQDNTTTTTTTTTTTNNNNNNNNNNGISHIMGKHRSTINSDPSHYLAQAFNNSFLNI
jgi:hypothetical protein